MVAGGERSRARFGVTAAFCLVFVAGMVGLSFAAVPLYRIFCSVTGYQGTVRKAEKAPELVLGRKMTIRFDANVANGLGWSFRPVQHSVEVNVGEAVKVEFAAENRTNMETTGTAAFNVMPDVAGAYFNKIACFCFSAQTLGPGQSVRMPVVFFVDPSIVKDHDLDDVDTITLSYTFFPATPSKPAAKPVAAASPAVRESPL